MGPTEDMEKIRVLGTFSNVMQMGTWFWIVFTFLGSDGDFVCDILSNF